MKCCLVVGLQDVWLGKWILGQGVELWSAPINLRGKRLARRSLRGVEERLQISQGLAYQAGVILV